MRNLTIVSILAVVLACPASAQHLSLLAADQAAAVDKAVRAEMDKQGAIGVAVGVVRGGRVTYLKGYGFADRETQLPITGKTLFRWASVSKPVTAVAAMQLWEKGQLDLDLDVCKLIPEFPDKGQKITPLSLLCNQSGVVHYAGVVRENKKYNVPHPYEDVVVALDTFKKTPLLHKPFEKYTYSTHGFVLLSAVVQVAGKQKFADQVRDRIGKPLGLSTLQPDYQWVNLPGRTIGYRKVKDEIVRSVDTDVSWKLGGGGLISNIDDMALFAAGLVNGKLVNAKTREKMWTEMKAGDKGTGYGLGFGVRGAGDKMVVSHSGSQEKTKTYMMLVPAKKDAIVVMCNSEFANPNVFATKVAEVLGVK